MMGKTPQESGSRTMSAAMKLLEMEWACAVCGSRGDGDLLTNIESLDAAVAHGEVTLQTKLAALANNKTISGHICTGCVNRAIDAWNFQQQLQASQAEPSLSDKIRVLRQRLRELTQKIDVFIVIGPEKTDGQQVYTEDNIIMVDKNMLGEWSGDEEEDAVMTASGGRVYQCSVCPESFPQLSDYVEHARLHPADSAHTCWTCGKQFALRHTLRAHVRTHHALDQLACKLCHAIFQGQVEMRNHACESRCPSCGLVAADRDALAQHARDTHQADGSAPHVCADCFDSFAQPEALVAHAALHRQTKQFVCGYEGCVQRFNTRNALMTHARRAHEISATSHTCTVCSQQFVTLAALRRHLKTHDVQPVTAPKRGRPKKVKTLPVKTELEEAHFEEATNVAAKTKTEAESQDYNEETHTVLLQQDIPEGSYQLQCVDGENMLVEMLEEEVEYLEVETLDEDLE